MPLDHSAIGVEAEPYERSWSAKDALLYAVGVGAGLDDPLAELPFTTENTAGLEQRVLPTFAVLAAQAPNRRKIGDFDPAMLVHAEQEFELHRPLAPDGTVHTTSKVTGIYDKGSGALVANEAVARDPATGEPMITSRSSMFIRGEGGFGGDRGPRDAWQRPDRAPDHVVTYGTRPEQALVYRLSGDRNPLHSDPEFAARAGFDRPILHGLCTYGVTGRALLHTLAGSDPGRFASMSGRFSQPVLPGESLTISIWVEGDAASDPAGAGNGGNADGTGAAPLTALFQTAKDDGTVVLDRGRVTVRQKPVN